MARGRGLILLAVLASARTVFGVEACDEERAATGLSAAVQGGAVAIADVASGSAADRAGFRAGDVVVQVNDVLARTCAQWARAVGEARDRSMAVLVLVRRGDAELPLALGAATWGGPAVARAPAPAPPPGERPAPARPAPAPPAPVAAPARTPPPPAPPPLPADTVVSVEGVLRDLAALAPLDDPPDNLTAYRDAVLQTRRGIETLGSRGAAPAEVVGELRAVARYHEGAVVAWEAMEGDREQERRSRRLPMAENLAVPYFSDSPVASLLDEFDFLDATVARRPRGVSVAESSGLWRPVWARLLLWERGNQALDELRARIGSGG